MNLSKEEVVFIGVKVELKQNYIKNITYEMLYFYVEELYELIKKWYLIYEQNQLRISQSSLIFLLKNEKLDSYAI